MQEQVELWLDAICIQFAPALKRSNELIGHQSQLVMQVPVRRPKEAWSLAARDFGIDVGLVVVWIAITKNVLTLGLRTKRGATTISTVMYLVRNMRQFFSR